MTGVEIYQQFIEGIRNTGWIEFIAVIMGIVSVWFSRKENIWVFPTGLINTSFYVYISAAGHLLGEASVNFYYTVMNIYGWFLWAKKDDKKEHVVKVTFSNRKEWLGEIIFFLSFFVVIYLALYYLKNATFNGVIPFITVVPFNVYFISLNISFFDGVIPWADAFASSTAFTGMWLMARKKVESWYFWILTNIASIPLYFVKGYVFTSVYYLILLGLAISGAIEWHKRGKAYLREQKAGII